MLHGGSEVHLCKRGTRFLERLFPTATDEGSGLLLDADPASYSRDLVGFTRRLPKALSRAASWEFANRGKVTTANVACADSQGFDR
jgi:hypothetical protein